MLASRGSHQRPFHSGFTLIELMIVVALIGVLAATAITNYTHYTYRSKRSEAYANLESIRTVQVAYFTEFGAFVSALPSPAGSVSGDKRNWKAGGGRFYSGPVGQGFELVGWLPEGAVFFDYDTWATMGASGPSFTASAYGDVDDDGLVSVFMFAYPDAAGAIADCGLCGNFASVVSHTGPPNDLDGNPVVQQVQQLQVADGGDDF